MEYSSREECGKGMTDQLKDIFAKWKNLSLTI